MIGCYERARRGDTLALERVVKALKPRLVKMSRYYARCSGQDADDLLQEAWLGLLEAVEELDTSIGSPEQYLILRARWCLLDAVRRGNARRSLPLQEAEQIAEPCGKTHTAFDNANLTHFLSELPATQRSVVGCLMRGLTWREAGERLGCSSANIAYHVRQIRTRYEKWNE